MKSLGTSKSEYDINLLMQQHISERDKCEARWSNELHQLQESQRTEYRDWMATVYNEMESYDKKDRSKLGTAVRNCSKSVHNFFNCITFALVLNRKICKVLIRKVSTRSMCHM